MQSSFFMSSDESISAPPSLPDDIIELILYHADPNTFASLIILDRQWRNIGDKPALYTHHIAQCPAWPEDDDDDDDDKALADADLPRLRRIFAQHVRRNLFDAYLRPKKTIIKLVAPSTSSSLAFPFGEVFKFSFSPKGRFLLAVSSSRIFIVHLSGPVPIPWRELEVSRRPIAVELSESGNFLAVLSPNQRVTTYRLDNHGVRCIQSVMLESPSAAIAISSDCSVLAAAHEQYIEIISLSQGPDQHPTSKRTVACNQVDHLAFHMDDAFLLGTSTKRRKPTTIVIPKPRSQITDEGSPVDGDPGRLWTTEVLFPNTFQSCSHAIALASKRGLSPRIFAFDVPADLFGVLDLEEMEYGLVQFALPPTRGSSLHLSTSMPAATQDGVQVAFPSTKTGICMYSDPNRLNATIEKPSLDDDRHEVVHGQQIPLPCKVSNLKWVTQKSENSIRQQLVAAVPGGSLEHDTVADQIKEPSDSGQIMLLNFDYFVCSDSTKEAEEITIDLNAGEIEKLEDDHIQLDSLIPLPRQELSASMSRQMRRQNIPLGRSITSAGRGSRRGRSQVSSSATAARPITIANGLPPLTTIPSIPRSATTASSGSRGRGDEAEAAQEDPYSHQQPRSRTTLQRAATAAAVIRRQHLRSLPALQLPMRRADGRGEMPHESDADNWVPPPPPYVQNSDTDLPHFLRHSSRPLETSNLRRLSDGAIPLVRSRSFDEELGQEAISRTSGSLHRSDSHLQPERPTLERALSSGSVQPEPTPSPGGIERAGIDPFSDESERPMSSNLADGWYSEPFPVWTNEETVEHEPMSSLPEVVTVPETTQIRPNMSQRASHVAPEPQLPPPIDTTSFEPDHFYETPRPQMTSVATPVSPAFTGRPYDLPTNYYGPQNPQRYPYPYQDPVTASDYTNIRPQYQAPARQSKWKKMFKCQIM